MASSSETVHFASVDGVWQASLVAIDTLNPFGLLLSHVCSQGHTSMQDELFRSQRIASHLVADVPIKWCWHVLTASSLTLKRRL